MDIIQLFDAPSRTKKLKASLSRLGQPRLATGDWHKDATPELKEVMLVLAAISRRPMDEMRIAELTGLSDWEISQILASCRRWDLVAPKLLRLTDKGLAELAHAKGISLSERILLNGSDLPYYPRSLRVGR